MTAFLIAIGFMLLMFGVAVLMLGALRWLVPDMEKMIPADWQKALSLKYGIYYLVAGLALAVLPG